jgi:hypothetical protein
LNLKNLSNVKPKSVTKLSEIWGLGSGILKKHIPDPYPGVKKEPYPRSATPEN